MAKQENFDEAVEQFERLLNVTVKVTPTNSGKSSSNPRNYLSDGFIFIRHDPNFIGLNRIDYFDPHEVKPTGSVAYDIYLTLLNYSAPKKITDLIDRVGFENWHLRNKVDELRNAEMLKNAKRAYFDIRNFVSASCFAYSIYLNVDENGESVLCNDCLSDSEEHGKLVGSLVCDLNTAITFNGNKTMDSGRYCLLEDLMDEKAKHQLERYNDWINDRFVTIEVIDNWTGRLYDTWFDYPIVESDVVPALDEISIGALQDRKDMLAPVPMPEINEMACKVRDYAKSHKLKAIEGRNVHSFAVATYFEKLNDEMCNILTARTGKKYGLLFSNGCSIEYSKFFGEFIDAIKHGYLSWDDLNRLAESKSFIESVAEECKKELVERG